MLLPPEWQQHNGSADFDLIAASLGHMQAAAAAGDYARAEAARLEAYALLESGPEARLFAFAPQYIAPIEGFFWYGQGENAGLAALLQKKASVAEIAAARQQLDIELAAAQAALGGQASPTAMALNAAILVFREGLEAVVILAALTASMVGARRMYRRPMALGVALAFVASALTWWLLQTVLFAFRGYGERLEAVVSLLAIGVLLLITNWFFHRVYWTDWMAELHSRKKTLLGGAAAGQIFGFLTLGFTSVYREGFETVLFLQALVLDAGFWPIFQGTVIGLLGVFAAGWLTFKLQSRLPYKRMLVGTGILIGVVLLVMVGNTVHVMQVVGWLPVHPIRWLALPYWMGLWFGTYATWEGILLQGAAATFVIGSYITAEALTKRGTRRPAERAVRPAKQETLVNLKR
jgi:high-affinity iron transporter